MDLTLFNKARAALAKAVTIDQAKAIWDKLEALRVYAKQAKGAAEMERQCAEIRLRAERRIGELLAATVRAGNPQLSPKGTIGLRDLGITRKQSAKWQAMATLPTADFERYVSTAREPTTAGVLRLVQERERAQQTGPASGGHILTGPASRLWERLADDSVDLFLTDPPYSDTERYRELAELAAVKLKPGGLCLAYCGQYHLPSVLAAMDALTYHWTFAIRFAGPHRPIYPKQIQNTWQPVVAFSRGKPAAGWIVDLLESGGREKDSHDWQKTLTDVEYLIEKLTTPGALVVDPYCGAGTVPAACRKLGRRWIGCEIDGKTARVARGRVAA